MNTALRMERIREVPPRFTARAVGIFYLLAICTAVFAEFIVPRSLGMAAVIIPVACYAVVTLLLYAIFRPVNPALALIAMFAQLIALTFEALRLSPGGVNLAMAFHGIFCLLIGYLIFRSIFMPRFLGALIALAGLIWLIYLLPSLADRLAPYNSAVGILGEALPMLWLLIMGVNSRQWKTQAHATEEL